MHLHRYLLALLDFQSALKEGTISDESKSDAYINMAICYKAIGEEKKAEVAFRVAERLSGEDIMRMQRIKELKEEEFEEKHCQEDQKSKWDNTLSVILNLSCAAFAVGISKLEPEEKEVFSKIHFQEEVGKGRFVVAKQDIASSDVLVEEDPYAACLKPDYFGTHCHNCFKRCVSLEVVVHGCEYTIHCRFSFFSLYSLQTCILGWKMLKVRS